MIEIKPNIEHQSDCPYCKSSLQPTMVKWQGLHVYVESQCMNCQAKLWESLRIGHTVHQPFQVDPIKGAFFCRDPAKGVSAQPFFESLQNPEPQKLNISKEMFKQYQQVIILNCIDYLYGHCLLKLLNAQRYLDDQSDYGLIVIVPQFLRWMVPPGVAEIWTVPISLKKGKCYYPSFAEFVGKELKRFEQVYLSKAYSHPSQFDITRFTGVSKHSFEQEEVKITFIWREDRPWCSMSLFRALRKFKWLQLGLVIQNWRVARLFEMIRSQLPDAKFVVAGLGTQTKFPIWIEDLRVDRFKEDTERELCQLYSESRLVIGVHGSNMLLPSAHAGMTLDLMPRRWGNMVQDILYQETNPRLAAFRYRYLPIQTSINDLADIALSMLLNYRGFHLKMMADQS